MEKISPIKQFCDKESGYLWNELAGAIGLSGTRYRLLERGAFENLPRTLTDLADEVGGPGRGAKLAMDYAIFRDSLSDEERAELEAELYPAGCRAYGMCP